jgi:hypothetical protein
MAVRDQQQSLIYFFCVAPRTAHDAVTDGHPCLRLLDDQWAFCPHDAHARGHVWERTGGITPAELLERTLARAHTG